MLVSKRPGGYTYVKQYDHGALAGELAERWGNDRFAPVAERFAGALTIAAAHHDDGWRELDDLPAHNEEAGRPAHFLELPLERTVPPYGRGVDGVYERDPLAGALAGMHWSGLYSGRWGLQLSGGPVPHPLAEQVVAEQERRRQEALREVWGFEGPRSEFEASAWHAYEVLQALDVISLALSLIDPSQPSDPEPEPVPLPGVLWAVEQPPGARLLPSVPTARLGEHADLVFTVAALGVAEIDPWPFGTDGFAAELPSRTVSEVGLPEAEAGEAHHAAAVEPIRWTLRPSRHDRR
jgi:Protein of unknown function (DUF3891)